MSVSWLYVFHKEKSYDIAQGHSVLNSLLGLSYFIITLEMKYNLFNWSLQLVTYNMIL